MRCYSSNQTDRELFLDVFNTKSSKIKPSIATTYHHPINSFRFSSGYVY